MWLPPAVKRDPGRRRALILVSLLGCGHTEPFVAPFRGMFQFDVVAPGNGSVFDFAAVVALIGWLLIYLLIMAILRLADRDRPA